MERISDAEDGAIAILDENTEIYNQSKELIRYAAQLERRQKVQPWVFTFGGIGFTAGGALLGSGIQQFVNGGDGASRVVTGGIIVGGVTIIYVIGHAVFGWW